jgi:predicted enzyme related to lactoylglutathione lyase
MGDIIVWADIPCTDLERAMKFYEHVTGLQVALMPGGGDVAVISDPASSENAVSADLYLGGTPTDTGATVYFGTRGDIDGMLARVKEAGGKVLQEKQDMGVMVGWIAFFMDSEGNRIGLQQPSS